MKSRRALAVVGAAVLAAVLALALAGCGSSDKSSASQTEEWADGMCGAIATWQTSMKTAGQKVSKGDLSKSTLQETADAVSDAGKQLRTDLEALGKPPTASADEARDALKKLADQLGKSADKIRDAFSDASSASDVAAAVTVATGAVQAMGQDAQAAAAELQSLSKDDAWAKAFKNSASCKKLTG
ncbi:MAG TPA: hypothetical protein VKB10_09515 [Gaiellaceae bacterium]|nr:hypothetical protein [Gaiellaceae bacterium]